jgi:hypothetical protein
MATHVGRNFCIAPFTQITYSPEGRYSPCAEIGGRLWKIENLRNGWTSPELTNLRKSFLEDQKNDICQRCWDQEDLNMQSLRRRLFTSSYLKKDIINFINKDYLDGPRQINLQVGNLCNLRCRICHAAESVTYNIEGEHYEKNNNLTNTIYTTAIKKSTHLSESQIEEIFNLSKNLIRLEFYGGEPLLDKPTLSLLEKLINAGKSKEIVLFYSTNGIVKPTDKHFELWNKFKSIEFNFSYDDIGNRFTYNRHPAKWNVALDNLNFIRQYPWQIPTFFQAFCTISTLNVYYLPEIIQEFDNLKLTYFLNTLNDPDYYDIRNLPQEIKQAVSNKLSMSISKMLFIENMLESTTANNQWEMFKFWTKQKDLYRKENFKIVFPEFYEILNRYDNTF